MTKYKVSYYHYNLIKGENEVNYRTFYNLPDALQFWILASTYKREPYLQVIK